MHIIWEKRIFKWVTNELSFSVLWKWNFNLDTAIQATIKPGLIKLNTQLGCSLALKLYGQQTKTARQTATASHRGGSGFCVVAIERSARETNIETNGFLLLFIRKLTSSLKDLPCCNVCSGTTIIRILFIYPGRILHHVADYRRSVREMEINLS